ncbi:hypothetical protein RPMA_19090 [Tardiphaga alba]|uniref:Uncharacterized protein n=1 Tax=Tardiphaga alba TaxID=340268 RepID=A0ABX8ABN2_9BRAD|nr:hypothetical protein [Tardiphaga alba]QUS40701.1 hypothetical protein RPMA_19090 [Tardiphaga alba]
MKKRYWIIGGLAALGLVAVIAGRSTTSNLCSKTKTVAELHRVFTSKLSRLGGKLLDDFAVHGKRGNDLICSVSFALAAAKGNPEEVIGSAPTTPAEMETYTWAMAMLPNVMVAAATSPGKPLVQRLTYQVAETASGSIAVRILDFPGAKNLR